jgi:hypothetical protein
MNQSVATKPMLYATCAAVVLGAAIGYHTVAKTFSTRSNPSTQLVKPAAAAPAASPREGPGTA